MESETYLIIPARNVESTLEKAVLSAHAQLKTNYQLIIIENGSSDQTATVANKLKQEHANIPIHILRSPPGKIHALVTGLDNVKPGKPIFFMDSDVEATKSSFKQLYDILSTLKCGVSNKESGLIRASPY